MGRIRLFDLTSLDRQSRYRSEQQISNPMDQPRLKKILRIIISRCHRKLITSLAWYPLDSGLFISGSSDQFVNVHDNFLGCKRQVWDTEAFEIVSHIRYKKPVLDVKLPDRNSFTHKMAAVVCGHNGVALIDLFSGNTTQEIYGGNAPATACYWNPTYEQVKLTFL